MVKYDMNAHIVKKLMTFFVTMILMFSVITAGVGAFTYEKNNETTVDDELNEELNFEDGDGSAANPYQISNWTHLYNVRNNMSANYILTASINSTTDGYESHVNTTEGWEPLGNFSTPFDGSFDGQDNIITGLYINRNETNYVGLFGDLTENALIQNVDLENANVTGYSRVGALAGESYGKISNSSATGKVSGQDRTGGLVGRNRGIVDNSYAAVNVYGDWYSEYIGGLVGTNSDSNTNYSMVNNSYATGYVQGEYYVGGLMGANWGSESYVFNSYATVISGYMTVLFGGIVGRNYLGTVNDSYWNTEMNNHGIGEDDGTSANVEGLMTVEMKGEPATTNMTALDFDNIWDYVYDSQMSYPYLRNNPQSPAPGLEPSYADGNGSADNPYKIENWYHLNNAGENLGANYTLVDDIDETTEGYEECVNTAKGWDPIGNSSDPFTGYFDGQGHTISGLFINQTNDDYIGLFGNVVGAMIHDVGVEDVNISGASYVGGLVGFIGVGEDTEINNTYSTGLINQGGTAGGLVGRIRGTGYVNNSYSSVNFTSDDGIVGGLVGSNYEGSMTNSYATGNVHCDGGSVGGLVGYAAGYSEVERCYATGDVSGDKWIGGLVGFNWGTVSNSYATGNVSGNKFAGGLVGENDGEVNRSYATGAVNGTDYVGGLAGMNLGWVNRSYSAGYVTGNNYVGGLVGHNESVHKNGTVENSFWDNETSEQKTSVGGTGKNTTDMKSVYTYTNTTTEGLNASWDFINDPYQDTNNSDIWEIDQDQLINDGYPYFTWEDTSVLTIGPTENGMVTEPGEGNYEYRSGETIDLEAVAAENYHFVEWTGDNGTIADTRSNKTTITLDTDCNITAVFAIDTHQLSVGSSAGGSVSAPGEGTFTYDHGTVVDLIATPDEGYHFVEWTGDIGTIEDTSSNEATMTLESDCSITAEFAIDTYELNISSSEGGQVTKPGEDTYTYDRGTTVDLVAAADENYHFVEWTGDTGTIAELKTNTTAIEMFDDYEIRAVFEEDEEDPTCELTVASDGNGTVTTVPDQAEYEEGSEVALTAEPDEGYEFVEWTGTDETGKEITIIMDEDKEITAVFEEEKAVCVLTVNADNGVVTIDPDQAEYEEGSKVTLTVEPSEGYEFVEWTGDGTGTSDEITITMDGDKTVTANFQEVEEGGLSTTMMAGIGLIIILIIVIIAVMMMKGGKEGTSEEEEEEPGEEELLEEKPYEEELFEEDKE